LYVKVVYAFMRHHAYRLRFTAGAIPIFQ